MAPGRQPAPSSRMRSGGRGLRQAVPVALAVAWTLAAPARAGAYSALAHEAIIDAAWDGSIVPALRARFALSDDDLKRARAFAYGGSLIQDIGYYPFSSRFFGHLTPYTPPRHLRAAVRPTTTHG